jgi:hypothetical protein
MEIGVLGHILAVPLLTLLQVSLQLLRIHEDQRIARLLHCLLPKHQFPLVVILPMHQRLPTPLLTYDLPVREVLKPLLVVEDVPALVGTLDLVTGQ